jgi:hypothetical protein
MQYECSLCVNIDCNILDARLCVICDRKFIHSYVCKFHDRYRELFNEIMTSKSHTDNLDNAKNAQIIHCQARISATDVLLSTIIASYAKLCLIRNRPDISIRYVTHTEQI